MTTTSDVHHVEHVMGTAVSIDVRAPYATGALTRRAVADAVAWLHHVDDVFSPYRNDSVITRLGRGELDPDELPREVGDVLRSCEQLRHLTAGAFDVNVVPAPNGTTFDPSGYVKGWALEHAANLLESRCSDNLCINGGGDVAVRGHAGPGRPWRIGIRHPAATGALATSIELTGPRAVATSGTYERGAHIIDPRTGAPTAEIASMTVLGGELGTTDALATAAFVMGIDGIAWIERVPDFEAYAITLDGLTAWTSGWTVTSTASSS